MRVPIGDCLIAVGDQPDLLTDIADGVLSAALIETAPHQEAIVLVDPFGAHTWVHRARNIARLANRLEGCHTVLGEVLTELQTRAPALLQSPGIVIVIAGLLRILETVDAATAQGLLQAINAICQIETGSHRLVATGALVTIPKLIFELRPRSWLALHGAYAIFNQSSAVDEARAHGRFGAVLMTGNPPVMQMGRVGQICANSRNAALLAAHTRIVDPARSKQALDGLIPPYVAVQTLAAGTAIYSRVAEIMSAPAWQMLAARIDRGRLARALLAEIGLTPTAEHRTYVLESLNSLIAEYGSLKEASANITPNWSPLGHRLGTAQPDRGVNAKIHSDARQP